MQAPRDTAQTRSSPALQHQNHHRRIAAKLILRNDHVTGCHRLSLPPRSGARFDLTAVRAAPPSQKVRWEAIARKLSDEDQLLKDVRDGQLRARVVNIPAQLVADA